MKPTSDSAWKRVWSRRPDFLSVMLAVVMVILLLWVTFELWIPHLLPR